MNSQYCENLMAARRANWRLFKPLKRFFASFSCGDLHLYKKKTAFEILKIVARALLFKLV